MTPAGDATLPAVPTATSDSPVEHYRLALALWCLMEVPDHGGIATAMLTDEQLDDAALGLSHALASRAVLTVDDEPQSTPVVVYDALAVVLRFIRARIDGRARDRAALLASVAEQQPSHPPDSHPQGGKPVFPPPPAPKPITPARQPAPAEVPF